MIILSDTADEQELVIIPRVEPIGDVDVTFESEVQNKIVHSFTASATYLNGYLTIQHTFSPVLVLNQFYRIQVEDAGALIWRGRCFVTDQTDLDKFTINEGIYNEPTQTNNEFIILE
jgi:hypothetical protein